MIIMLKGIPNILSPDLLKILMEMGHGDEIVIGDGNFPAAAVANKLLRFDGHGVPEILQAILKFFPLDSYSESQVFLMAVVKGDPVKPTIWEEYKKILADSGNQKSKIEFIERFDFYERAKKAYVILATSEAAQYGNVILKKGVVLE